MRYVSSTEAFFVPEREHSLDTPKLPATARLFEEA
jgi:hypothetical protein